MIERCDGFDSTDCHWGSSTICMDCIRFENFKKESKHWGGVKDWFITSEDHAEDIKKNMKLFHQMMSKTSSR